jgi:hypothetical protein
MCSSFLFESRVNINNLIFCLSVAVFVLPFPERKTVVNNSGNAVLRIYLQ